MVPIRNSSRARAWSAARVEKGESARLRVLGEDRLGDSGRLVREWDVGTRAEELCQVVRKRFVAHELPDRGRGVSLARGRACERLVGLRVGDDIARCLDHEAVVQVRDAEVVHGIAVVVPKRDHGRGWLDQEVEVEQGLLRAGEGLQPHLVEALEDLASVAVARPVADPVPHAITSCAVSGRWEKNSSSTPSPMR